MRLATFLALGAIVGVDLGATPKDPKQRTKQQKTQNQRSMNQCIKKDWNYPERGGRLSQVVVHLSKLCKGYFDRPQYQCRCLQRQKALFWNLMKSRRVCSARKRQHDRQQAKKEAKREENKSRKRREDEEDHSEDINDFDETNDVMNAEGVSHLNQESSIADQLDSGETEISVDDMDGLVNDQCASVDNSDADAVEECQELAAATEELRSATTEEEREEAKERADVMFRIIRMHRAMASWAEGYIATGPFCDKQAKMKKRITKNRRRMQRKRKLFPTNPTKLKKKKQQQRQAEEEKAEKAAARAAQ
jgi:hypothetical protein